MLPFILPLVGSLLPMIIDSLRSGKSPEEAAAVIAPKRKELIDRLVGAGLAGPAAEAMADEAMKGELEKAQLPEQMNPLVMSALSVAGMFGGMKAGKMWDARKLVKTVPAGAPAPAEVKAATKPVVSSKAEEVAEDVYKPGFRSPAVDKAMTGSMDSVTAGGPFPSGRNIGYTDTSGSTLARLTAPPQRIGQTITAGPPVEPRGSILKGVDLSTARDAEYRLANTPFPTGDEKAQIRAMQELRRRQMMAQQGMPDYAAREVGQPVLGDVAL